MLNPEESLVHASLVALGAIAGSWLRFKTINYYSRIWSRRYWGTLIVNFSSSFLLGFILAFHSDWNDSQVFSSLVPLLLVGFLGSLSTFSTFIFELLEIIHLKRFKEFGLLLVSSVFGGLIIAIAGYGLGYK